MAGYPATISVGVAIVGVALFLVVIQATYQLPLSNDLRLNWVAALELVRQAVTVVAIVLLVVAGASLGPFYLVTFAGGLAALVPTMLLVRGRVPLRPAFDRPEWVGLVRDAPAYAVASAIGFVYFRVEVVLISLIGTEAQTGDFGVAFRIVEIVAGIPLLASVSLFPLLTRAGPRRPRAAHVDGRAHDRRLLRGRRRDRRGPGGRRAVRHPGGGRAGLRRRGGRPAGDGWRDGGHVPDLELELRPARPPAPRGAAASRTSARCSWPSC